MLMFKKACGYALQNCYKLVHGGVGVGVALFVIVSNTLIDIIHECQKVWKEKEMIIRSIFRRYEKWNPVHPTYGAFWGMGVGIGCGIGWGPGFGPEVVGYVGAGCGAGFSVGITFLGLGIGLPANYLLQASHSAVVGTTRGALDVARISSDGWRGISSQISENWMGNMIDFPGMKSALALNAKHITDCFQRAKGRFSPSDGGPNT